MAIQEIAKTVTLPISSAAAKLDSLSNRFIVKPKGPNAVDDFVFDIEDETEITLQSEITDHFTERGEAVQDHIALRPIKIRLRGYAGELVYAPPQGLRGALEVLQDRLSVVPAYLQDYTPQQLQILQQAITKAQKVLTTVDFAFSRVKRVVGGFRSIFDGSAPVETRLEEAYRQLWSSWETKQIFDVMTPFEFIPNVAIESVTFIQPEDTQHWADISIVLKQLRFVDVETIKSKSSNRNLQQRQSTVDKGKTQGTTREKTLLKRGLDALFPTE